ncbi:suppressor of fused domain protein [Nocardia sp. NPDC056064]|uniref:suppressor of fused domain protein n=1 Tax=Nocardia sp. NPDC056064 TaxID=3345701 RepID=UPI0035DEA377
MVGASPLLRAVFRDVQHLYGPEDEGFVFEDGPGPIGHIDVLVYRPTPRIPVTTFATVGMAAGEMPATPGPGAGGRAELRFSWRGQPTPEWESAVAQLLANLAAYPWITDQQLGWGHMMTLEDDFPGFPDCRTVMFAGPLFPDAQDIFEADGTTVRILNIVPLTDTETARARTMPSGFFLTELMNEVDLFSPR